MQKWIKNTLLMACFVSPMGVAEEYSFPQIETTGVGEIIVAPDMAEFSVQVVKDYEYAQIAKKMVDKVAVDFLARLEKLGVKRTDIEAGNISLTPQYSYPKNSEPKLEGYRAMRSFTVKVYELNKLNALLDGALGDGINQINNLSLKVRDEDKYQEKVRQVAIKDAQAKANSLARGFDQKIQGPWVIKYNSRSPMPIQYRSMKMDDSAAVANSYQDSSITIRDSVNVIFKLVE